MAKIFLLIGPSCAGKSTVQAALLERFPDLVMAKGVWTRPHRPGETDETADSRSISNRQFQRLLNEGELTAVNHVHGHWYGTPIDEFVRPLAEGKSVIRIVTDQGAIVAMEDLKTYPIVTIYLCLPIHITVERLLKRGDKPEDIVRRVKTAEDEMKRLEYQSWRWDWLSDAADPLVDVVDEVAGVIREEMAG